MNHPLPCKLPRASMIGYVAYPLLYAAGMWDTELFVHKANISVVSDFIASMDNISLAIWFGLREI